MKKDYGEKMKNYTYISLREKPELKNCAAEWFHSKWGVPAEAYLECMEAYLNKKTGKKVLVHLLGGDLQIEYDEEKDTIFMTGPATTVFDGEIDLTGIDD